MTKIRLTSTSGKPLQFTAAKIKLALIGRNAGVPEHWGEAHVWALDPVMVCIYKLRKTKQGPFYYEITEVDENSRGNIVDLLCLQLKDNEIDEAITIFMKLCEQPKKKLQNKLIKKMGGHVIILNKIATKSPTRKTK